MTADIVTTSQDLASNSGEDSAIPLFGAESLSWISCEGLIAYSRESPSQTDRERHTGEWQPETIAAFADSHGLRMIAAFHDVASDSRTIGPIHRPQLIRAIDYARQTRCPIVAFEHRRFTRQPHKLRRFDGVAFISIVPLSITDDDILNARCRRAANRIMGQSNPGFKGGRPLDAISESEATFILESQHRPASEVARSLGKGWDRRRVKRLRTALSASKNKWP